MSLEWWRSDDVSILCEEATCELYTVLRKTLLGESGCRMNSSETSLHCCEGMRREVKMS